MKIVTLKDGQKIGVDSGYYPPAIAKFKALGGRWDGALRMWVFDARDSGRLAKVIDQVFGTGKLYTIHYVIDGREGDESQLFKFGRSIASRRGRDDKVRLGDGVSIITGSFGSSGGSAKYPRICGNGPVTVQIRDVPASLLEGEDIVKKIEQDGERPPTTPKTKYQRGRSGNKSAPLNLPLVATNDLIEELVRRGWKRDGNALWKA